MGVKPIHVYPLNDAGHHSLETMLCAGNRLVSLCDCDPKYEYQGSGLVIIHNSFDGREGVEWVNEILNND